MVSAKLDSSTKFTGMEGVEFSEMAGYPERGVVFKMGVGSQLLYNTNYDVLDVVQDRDVVAATIAAFIHVEYVEDISHTP